MPSNAAHHLLSLRLNDGWVVRKRMDLGDHHTGSAFSVGYLAEHEQSGETGYLKAFDYSEALAHPDPARALGELTASYNAERDLLDHCGTRRLSRVVRAWSAGTARVPGFTPDAVSYLIFEIADGDARDLLQSSDPGEHLPILRLAHHAAVAMFQLHSIRVCHQDVKPSNLLFWQTPTGPAGKFGDLGAAHLNGRPAPHDDALIPGDPSYAAPEQLYAAPDTSPSQTGRYAADIYMLGNLFTFLLTGVTHSGLLNLQLDRSHHWMRWGGTYEDVIPALLDAHGSVSEKLEHVLHADIVADAIRIIDELCHPDLNVRGDPVARRRGTNPYSLERYITRFDLMYRRAIIADASRR